MPDDLARQAVTHSSWTERRSESYERLAFLGDSVLVLAVTTHLYPRLQADAYGAGRLTKIRAQAVSGRSCREVAERLGMPERLRNAAPPAVAGPADGAAGAHGARAGLGDRGRDRRLLPGVRLREVAEAVVEAFTPEIERALTQPADFKSALQERLARRGTVVAYEIVAEEGPPHERTFEVVAMVDGDGARARLRPLEEGRRAGRRRGRAGSARRAVTCT